MKLHLLLDAVLAEGASGILRLLVLQIQNLLNLILVAVALSESSEADVLGGLLHPESLLLFHATLEIW